MSVLPTSYPGHSILTEDIGELSKKNVRADIMEKNLLFMVGQKNQS